MKHGRQGLSQGKFAFTASVARIVLPISSEMLEQYVCTDISFTICLFMIAASVTCVLLLYRAIVRCASLDTTFSPDLYSVPTRTPTGLPAVLDTHSARYSLLGLSGLMAVTGCALFFYSTVNAIVA